MSGINFQQHRVQIGVHQANSKCFLAPKNDFVQAKNALFVGQSELKSSLHLLWLIFISHFFKTSLLIIKSFISNILLMLFLSASKIVINRNPAKLWIVFDFIACVFSLIYLLENISKINFKIPTKK